MNLNIKAQKNEVWSFNNSGYYKYQDLTKDSLLHIPNGISEQAIILDSKQKQYLSVPFTPNESAFSVSFWFQVNDNKTYPLLRQTQTENKKIEQFTITEKKQSEKIVGELLLKSGGKTRISRIDKKQRIFPQPRI